jgi:hypothetical protein
LRRAGDATEPEERRALDVGAQAHAVHQARVDARRGQPGHRREEDAVDVARDQSRMRQRIGVEASARSSATCVQALLRSANELSRWVIAGS